MINPHPGLPEFDYVKPATRYLRPVNFWRSMRVKPAHFLAEPIRFVRMRDGHWKEKYHGRR